MSNSPNAVPARLNLAQQQAVNHLHGPCLVLAGAGSGKTRVITHKIARLIQTGIPADRIVAITFTNKAAAEMRERARGLIGAAVRDAVICTFHALGVRMLRQDGSALGLKSGFSILDSDDVCAILKDAGGTVDAATARQWQWTISLWKNMGLNAERAAQAANDEDQARVARVMAHYEERLLAYQAVDFDDLIGLPLRLLREHESVRTRWQSRMGHVLVDEYQDTNATQYELLRLLVAGRAPREARFTAVGDDDQSIYGWRGATLDNLRKLPVDFPELQVIKLEQNYRSTGAILRAANRVIGPNPKLFVKSLWSELGEGEPVRVVEADHEDHEAERAVARIQSLRAGTLATAGSQALEYRNFAILYRANHQARPFEKALRRAQIPYRVTGGTSLFDRTEIKDLCSWFRLWINADDDPAFLRAVTTPRRGIGHQTLQQLGAFAGRYKVSLFEALYAPSLGLTLPARSVAGLHEFGRAVDSWRQRAGQAEGEAAATAFLRDWLQDIGYEAHLRDTEDSPTLAQARWANVTDFCEWMAARCGGRIEDPSGLAGPQKVKSLLDVAQTISLLSTLGEREQDPNQVTLSTLHAAKGLEWPHVLMVGVNEGLLPFRADEEATESAQSARLEEERRLMYVGITRAQSSLAVSWSRRRKRGRDQVASSPSRFIAEMALDAATTREDPREKLRALRAEFARRSALAVPAGDSA
ncbi:MAG: ATP-dependent DNA helicase Rep [Rhodoferax sp.]|nr:ATP-dependent DNA helicase Rep [Rhodoferax sp.]